MEKYNFLHERIKHTNQEFPVCDYIGQVKYPEQDSEKVGRIMNLTIRLKNIKNQSYLTDEESAITTRPEDDNEVFDTGESQEVEETKIYTTEKPFLVIRFDTELPNKFVAISLDFEDVVVSTTDAFDKEEAPVFEVPDQNVLYIGYKVKAKYLKKLDIEDSLKRYVEAIEMGNFEADDYNESYILSCDLSEPAYSVIVQYLGATQYRVITDDECLFELIEPADWEGDDDVWRIHELRRRIIEGRIPYGFK